MTATSREQSPLLDQAFSRAAGAHRIGGNRVCLLRDAAENYPAWLDGDRGRRAIRPLRELHHPGRRLGRQFAEALTAKARGGRRGPPALRLDGRVWQDAGPVLDRRCAAAGVEVRCFNPPRLASPLGWVHRDHRKSLVVDGTVGFVTGLCVADAWVGDAARGIAPWRDTGHRGPRARRSRKSRGRSRGCGPSPARRCLTTRRPVRELPVPAGDVAMRIVATEPCPRRDCCAWTSSSRPPRARRSGSPMPTSPASPSYVQALRAAALDGVDVRLLVPGGTDIPILRPLSRAGYRPLLEAGVRVFEWNGPMMHAKTAVADGRWARVGSTNLNIASWLGNYELDVVIEDVPFAQLMMRQYETDLTNATEVLLHGGRRVRGVRRPAHGTGSAGRATVGALRLGNTVTAAVAGHRVLAPAEARIVAALGAALLVAAGLAFRWPRLLAWPLAVLLVWLGGALLARAWQLRRGRPTPEDRAVDPGVQAEGRTNEA